MKKWDISTDVSAFEFAPSILQSQHAPPSPYSRLVLYTLLVLFAVLLVWAIFGKLDIVAVAQEAGRER